MRPVLISSCSRSIFIFLFSSFSHCRYRMVAKDFTLQQSLLPLTRVWVECHERMARWFILMDHRMQAAGVLFFLPVDLFRVLVCQA